MPGIQGRLARVLANKQRVITRAVFWKIPHNTRPSEIHLKIGRYDKPRSLEDGETPESLMPRSELTLDGEEFDSLIAFLQENYEPFKHGVRAFIPLERPFSSENAEQIRALFSVPETAELVRFIFQHKVIPEELAQGLRQARRARAIGEFRKMLALDLVEQDWQNWFQANSWVLGSEFVRILDERTIDTENISDFLMEAYDGFVDVVEIKRPGGGLRFWAHALDHGNPIPSHDLVKAVTQASRYIFEVEREANSLKFLKRVDGVRTVKPRCILLFGRSHDWNDHQAEAYRILNSSFHNLTVMTYDHVLARAQRILDLGEE